MGIWQGGRRCGSSGTTGEGVGDGRDDVAGAVGAGTGVGQVALQQLHLGRGGHQAVERVIEGTAGKQRVTGPIRVVPWTEVRRTEWLDDKGIKRFREEKTTGHLLQMPKTLGVTGRLAPSERAVGVYKVRVNEWHADLEATFEAALPGPALIASCSRAGAAGS